MVFWASVILQIKYQVAIQTSNKNQTYYLALLCCFESPS